MTSRKPPVTIFGAGIAGLTAAHELVTRGFDVQVLDPDYNAEQDGDTLDRGIGGMARSQWSLALNDRLGGTEMLRLWSGTQLLLDTTIEFAGGKPQDEAHADAAIARLAAAYLALGAKREHVISIVLPGAERDTVRSDPRARYLLAALARRKVSAAQRARVSFVATDGAPDRATFVPSGQVVPAEHGFRFFPAFYRHLFDTMRRTPLRGSQGSTFGHLVPSEGLGFARDRGVSFMIPRHAVSMDEMRRIIEKVFGELGYTATDLGRFTLKLFKYLTSSSRRRSTEYEDLSWGAFLEVSRYSAISREHIEFGPQMSAALRGSASDARTQGNITVQLLMDLLNTDARTDYTLAGPTSSHWLDHWHDFLVRQGVRFARGRVTGFAPARRRTVAPVVESTVPVTGQLFVFALSLPAMAPLAQCFVDAARSAGVTEPLDEMTRVIEFAGDLDSLKEALPSGPLQHLSGIQYYFDQDLRFWRGHTQYLDSRWGLTSIAQPQFWTRPREESDGYRSILSVDIGIFDRAYAPRDGGPPRTVWTATAEEIASYAWEQIVDHHQAAFEQLYGKGATIPTPIAFSLDAHLHFAPTRRGSIRHNASPFLVNKTSAYRTRPGGVNATGSKAISGYEVILGKYVLAGTHMQTFTRLTSMEGANESARHAVNALLRFLEIPGDQCQIWDPEDHEPENLRGLKELDDELCRRGLPHFVDILRWQELPAQLRHIPTLVAGLRGLRARGEELER